MRKNVTGVYYGGFLQRLWRKLHKIRPQLLQTGPLILHDNAHPHIANVIIEKLLVYGWEVLLHPPYSPDMSPPDYDLFPKLKKPMRGRHFSSLEELSVASTRAVRRGTKIVSWMEIVKLPKRWDSVIEKHGNYIEGM